MAVVLKDVLVRARKLVDETWQPTPPGNSLPPNGTLCIGMAFGEALHQLWPRPEYGAPETDIAGRRQLVDSGYRALAAALPASFRAVHETTPSGKVIAYNDRLKTKAPALRVLDRAIKAQEA